MKPLWTVVLGIVLISQRSLLADEPEFRYSKAIDRSLVAQEEILAVPLDPEICAATRDGFLDVRIRDDRGAEVPYVLKVMSERRIESAREPCDSRVISLRPEPGKALVIVVRLGDNVSNASGLTIFTPLKDYEHRVKVFGSSDEKDWSPLVSDGLIFDYSRYMDIHNRDVALAKNEFRSFKIEIDQDLDERESPFLELTRRVQGSRKDRQVEVTRLERRPFRVDRIEMWRTVEHESAPIDRKLNYPIDGFQIEPDEKEKLTRVLVRTRREPLTAFILETASRNFNRAVKLRAPVISGARTDWLEIAHGTIYRYAFRGFRREHLQIDFPERREEQFQLVIENGDSPPLEITSGKAEGNLYRLIFLPSGDRGYRVEYGSQSAQSPQYDTATVLAGLSPGFQPAEVRLGAQSENPRYRAERDQSNFPYTTIFLAAAIILMVLVLGWILFRAGQKIKDLPLEDV